MFPTARIGLVVGNPQCPKCKSYMVFPREGEDGVWFHKCHCGHTIMPKWYWLRRLKFWKS